MPTPSAKTVLLLHTLPDGSSHFDWLIDWRENQVPDLGDGLLLTFRVAEFLPSLPLGTKLSATRLPDHRRLYLSYEGSVSRNRGTVRRIAQGVSQVTQLPNSLRILSLWDSVPVTQLWEGLPSPSNPQLWEFVSLPPPTSADS